MIKCVVFDLDGTLFYNSGKSIYDLSPESAKAIELMKKNGIKFAISSGRQYPISRKIMNDYVGEFTPSCNMTGSIIHDNDQIVYKSFMDRKKIDLVINTIKDLDFGYIECFDEKGVCLCEIKDEDFFYSNKEHFSSDTLYGFEENINKFNELGKIMLVHKDADTCKKNLSYIEKHLKGIVNFTISTGIYIEITDLGCSKLNIIKYLKEAYNYNNDEIAVVGDSENDVVVLNAVKYSYIMFHADEDIKKLCYKTVNNCLEVVEDCLVLNSN